MPRANKKVTVKRGRKPKSAVVEKPALKLVGDKVAKADKYTADLFDESPAMPATPEPDELRPDQDLDAAQRAEFAKLLNSKMSLMERADRLVALAHKNCTKTAAVGLRAITIINEITGVSEDVDKEAPSMFTLPEGATVSIEVETPEK